jgi:hypothetical protein
MLRMSRLPAGQGGVWVAFFFDFDFAMATRHETRYISGACFCYELVKPHSKERSHGSMALAPAGNFVHSKGFCRFVLASLSSVQSDSLKS